MKGPCNDQPILLVFLLVVGVAGATNGTIIPDASSTQNNSTCVCDCINHHDNSTNAPTFLPSLSNTPSESPSVFKDFFRGDMASFHLEVFNESQSVRQNVCDRHDRFHNDSESFPLRAALGGLALNVIIGKSDYFPYDEEQGIDPAYPGLIGEILDDLARRANFTWRSSFAVQDYATLGAATYTDILLWNTKAYDISVDRWDKTPERMEGGIAFLEPWLDGSKILISREVAKIKDASNVIDPWNWTKPFEVSVWALVVFTIVLSGMVYQFIEYLQGEQNDRTFGQWTSDNLYLSAINFSQNFEYAPTSAAARIFATSMTLWALVMTATYTANLASLFVENNRQIQVVDSIEQAVVSQTPVCVVDGSFIVQYLRREYPGAILKPKKTELEMYQALQQGRCGLAVSYKDGWLTVKGDNRFNPTCELDVIGNTLLTAKSGFAIKADAGQFCTSFIRDVLNLHLVELIQDGALERIKETHRRKVQSEFPNNCVDPEKEVEEVDLDGQQRRLLLTRRCRQWEKIPLPSNQHRHLQTGATFGSNSVDESPSLTLEQMMGTFLVHWMLMAIAVGLAAVRSYWSRARRAKESDIAEPPDVEEAMQATDTACSIQESYVSSGGFDWEAEYARMSIDERAMVDFLFKRMHLQGRLPTPFRPDHSNTKNDETASVFQQEGMKDVDLTESQPAWSLGSKQSGFALQFPFCK